MTEKNDSGLTFVSVMKCDSGWFVEIGVDLLNEATGENFLFMLVSESLSEVGSIIAQAGSVDDPEELPKFFSKFSSDGEQNEIPPDSPPHKKGKK